MVVGLPPNKLVFLAGSAGYSDFTVFRLPNREPPCAAGVTPPKRDVIVVAVGCCFLSSAATTLGVSGSLTPPKVPPATGLNMGSLAPKEFAPEAFPPKSIAGFVSASLTPPKVPPDAATNFFEFVSPNKFFD